MAVLCTEIHTEIRLLSFAQYDFKSMEAVSSHQGLQKKTLREEALAKVKDVTGLK